MTAARNASLYYSRRRTASLRGVPRLFRTHLIPQGTTRTDRPLPDNVLDQPITFKTKVHLDNLGIFPRNIFRLGFDISVDRITATVLRINVRGVDVLDVTTPESGIWTLIFSIIPGDRRTRTWNQYRNLRSIETGDLPNNQYVDTNTQISTGSTAVLAEGLSLYVNQVPRNFIRSVPDTVVQSGLYVLHPPEGMLLDDTTLYGVFNS